MGCRKGGRLIRGTAYTRVYTVSDFEGHALECQEPGQPFQGSHSGKSVDNGGWRSMQLTVELSLLNWKNVSNFSKLSELNLVEAS